MKPASIMVWVAVSKTWRSLLIFIDQSAKIKAKYYVYNILEPMLKSAKNHFGNDTLWTFQQDDAASHIVNVAQNWCREHIFRFWSKEMWPLCSPDLNLMDFLVWSILEAKVCGKIHHIVVDLKQSLLRAWQEIAQEQLCASTEDVCRRLQALIKSNGAISNKITLFALYRLSCNCTYL